MEESRDPQGPIGGTTAISPLPGRVPEFAAEFVYRMRLREVTTPTGTRQAMAIAGLLTGRFFRRGSLTLQDFVDVAVMTTRPEDQQLARETAEEIVFGHPPLRGAQEHIDDTKHDVFSETDDHLVQLIEQIRREIELSRRIHRDRVETGYHYLNELESRVDATELRRAVFESRNGTPYLTPGEVILRGISTDDELREAAGEELMSRIGSLTSQDIANSRILHMLDRLCESADAAERLAAKAYRGDADIYEEFELLARSQFATALRALSLMTELGRPDAEVLERMDATLQDSIQRLDDAVRYAETRGRAPRNIRELLRTVPQQYRLTDAMELARSLTRRGAEDLEESVLAEYDSQFDERTSSRVDLEQLAETTGDSASWKRILEKKVSSLISEATARSDPVEFLLNQMRQILGADPKFQEVSAHPAWQEAIRQFSEAAVSRTLSAEQLRRVANDMISMGVTPPAGIIQEAGRRLGLSTEEIEEILQPDLEIVRALIEKGVHDIERLYSVMVSARVDHGQLRGLADLAVAHANREALGAIARIDLHAALGTPSLRDYGPIGRWMSARDAQTDPDRIEMVVGGLLAGPASDVVTMWYRYRDEIPSEVRRMLKDVSQRILVELGSRLARATMGSSMLGGLLESPTVRPYRLGDEEELISIEDTLENILSQGRTSIEYLDLDDILVIEDYRGQRAFYWALDKSRSMDSAEKLGMLSIAVMAGISAVQKDDFGVLLFDSETRVMKRITDHLVPADKIALGLLEVRAGGGTGGREAMRLALHDLRLSGARDKFFIFSSDMYLSDLPQCIELARQMAEMNIRVRLVVPSGSYDRQAAEQLARASRGVIVDIGSLEELPVRLLRLTDY